MHDQPKGAGEDASSNQQQDLRDQRAVLTHVLALQPTYVIVPELVREVSADAADFAESDRIERAVRDLVGVGLLRCHRGLLLPTRAAERFDTLDRA